MTRNLALAAWGVGGMVCSAPGTERGTMGAGGTSASDDLDRAGKLAAMGAAEAIDTLNPAGLADKMPDAVPVKFPGPIAERYFWDDERVVGIQGPVGSGKTTTKMMRKMRRAVMMPRSVIDGRRRYRVLFTRETYRQLWSSVIPSYLKVFPKSFGQWSGGRGDPVRHYIEFEDEHGTIEFEALFMAFGDSIEESLRGIETTDLDISEADTNPLETLTFGVGRIGRWPEKKHLEGYPAEILGIGQIDCDFNAPEEDNWTTLVFHDPDKQRELGEAMSRDLPAGSKPIKFTFYRQPGYGEPGVENVHNLPVGYYETQIALNKLAGRSDVTSRMVYNRVTTLKVGDPVFSLVFNRRVHVAEGRIPVLPGRGLILGLDQGFKAAATVWQFEEPFHWYCLAELHFPKERLFAAEFGRRLAALLDTRFPGVKIDDAFGDMAGDRGSAEAEEKASFNKIVGQAIEARIRGQYIGANQITPRLEAMRAPLEFLHAGKPGLLIDPSCRFLIRGFETHYVWAEEITKTGDKRKIPDKTKTEANVMDSGQYALLSKHRANGLSPITNPKGKTALLGLNSGPRSARKPASGLVTGFSVSNPYGD